MRTSSNIHTHTQRKSSWWQEEELRLQNKYYFDDMT